MKGIEKLSIQGTVSICSWKCSCILGAYVHVCSNGMRANGMVPS